MRATRGCRGAHIDKSAAAVGMTDAKATGVEAKVLRLRPGEYSFPTTVSLADACLAMYSTGEGEVVISAEAEERFFAVGSGGRLHLKARASPALTTASLFHELLPCLTLSPSALGCLSWLWRLPAPPAWPALC